MMHMQAMMVAMMMTTMMMHMQAMMVAMKMTMMMVLLMTAHFRADRSSQSALQKIRGNLLTTANASHELVS